MTTRSTLFTAIGCGILLLSVANTSIAAEYRTVADPIEGRYIVVLEPHSAALAGERSAQTTRGVPSVASTMAKQHGARLVRSYSKALRGFVVEAHDKALEKLLADPRVAYVEEDGVATVGATQHGATWGLDRVDQRSLPLNSAYTYNNTATGVHAYVIDTGINAAHTQFSGRIGNGFSAVAGGTADCNGHGTHVAGTLGGTTWGVAKGVTIHPVRVFGCGNSGSWSDIIAGIDWVANNRTTPAVANLSLGGPASTSVDAAVNGMIASGVVAVVAAGNDSSNACQFSPARVPAAITVGSTSSNDARSWFSNWGTCLDIFAPGSSITSAWHSSNTASHTIDGTSMAAPHVAGAAALYLSSNPAATPTQVASAITSQATSNVVGNAGTGSPNRMLYTLQGNDGGGSPPSITSFWCPDRNNSGSGTYMCFVGYASSLPATVSWTGSAGQETGDIYFGTCSRYQTVWATVTVSNTAGSVSRSAQFSCPTYLIP